MTPAPAAASVLRRGAKNCVGATGAVSANEVVVPDACATGTAAHPGQSATQAGTASADSVIASDVNMPYTSDATIPSATATGTPCAQPKLSDLLFSEPIIPRPSRLLDTDFAAARKKMQQMEEIVTQLGGLDCGSCGAPNCRALAEDIVRKNAVKEDCVIVLKAQYEQMLFGKKPQ